jgi:hypothetical protein
MLLVGDGRPAKPKTWSENGKVGCSEGALTGGIDFGFMEFRMTV